jgi:hypothetical protein
MGMVALAAARPGEGTPGCAQGATLVDVFVMSRLFPRDAALLACI